MSEMRSSRAQVVMYVVFVFLFSSVFYFLCSMRTRWPEGEACM